MRKVIIGTPVHAGEFLDLRYVESLSRVLRDTPRKNIDAIPVWTLGDLSHARNKIVRFAVEQGADDILFIDSDIGWKLEDFYRILSHDLDAVSGVYQKRQLAPECCFRVSDGTKADENGLAVVDWVGCGFMRLRKFAYMTLWERSRPYSRATEKCREVFGFKTEGEFISEDINMCRRWQGMRGKVYIDMKIFLTHSAVIPLEVQLMREDQIEKGVMKAAI